MSVIFFVATVSLAWCFSAVSAHLVALVFSCQWKRSSFMKKQKKKKKAALLYKLKQNVLL
jgi:hypothetical protein